MPIIKDKKFPIRFPAPETVIWRYMDFAKFVSLLDRKALFLTRVGRLADIDPYEGRLGDWQAIQTRDPKNWKIGPTMNDDTLSPQAKRKLLRDIGPMFIKEREDTALKRTFVSCWHMNEGESDAMWRLYSLQGQGIAVRTTFDRLRRSLSNDEKPMYAGKVIYGDYERHTIDINHDLHIVFNKRQSFAHESELRIAHMLPRVFFHPKDAVKQNEMPLPDGIYAKTKLNTLIEQILISPASPSWLLGTIQALVKRYRLNPEIVRQSPLYQPRSV